jgi:hypothetical protein
MGIEEFEETWTRVELTCDGLGDIGECVGDTPEEGPSYIVDVANGPEGAHRTVEYQANQRGWVFELMTKRWLCPVCIKARAGQ